MTRLEEIMNRPFEICLRNKSGRIVAWEAGYSKSEFEALQKAHPDWYRSIYYLDEQYAG